MSFLMWYFSQNVMPDAPQKRPAKLLECFASLRITVAVKYGKNLNLAKAKKIYIVLSLAFFKCTSSKEACWRSVKKIFFFVIALFFQFLRHCIYAQIVMAFQK